MNGVDLKIMGLGPVGAIPKALARAGFKYEDKLERSEERVIC